MASSPHSLHLSSLLLLLFLSPSTAAAQKKPHALVLPVTKDTSTLQYVTKIRLGTPSALVSLVLDLGARYSWVDCEKSSSLRPVGCKTRQCAAAFSAMCNVDQDICGSLPYNPITNLGTIGDLSEDVVSIQTTDQFNLRSPSTIPHVVFSCAPKSLLEGFAGGAKGILGFGRTAITLPSQVSSTLGLPNKFAVCLPSAGPAAGAIFFGEGPYRFLQNALITSASLSYTPLYINPRSTSGSFFAGEPSAEYFVKVTSIEVNGKTVPINPKLFGISKRGNGGAKISTVNPYTVLQSSIYRAVTAAFTKATGFPRVSPVGNFSICYDSKNMSSSPAGADWRLGPPVPTISLVMENNSQWIMFGFNSMVQVRPGVMCLGLLDGGNFPRTFIVIGGHQVEDTLLEFDLDKSRVGFSGSVLLRETSCSNLNFNFTSA